MLQSEDDIYNESKYADFLSENDFRDIKEPCEFEIKYPYSEEELEKMYNTSIKSMTLRTLIIRQESFIVYVIIEKRKTLI